MKNKMVLIIGSILILFVALYFVVNYKNEKQVEKSGNPYEKNSLRQETIDQLNDPLYQNQIVPADLSKKIENNEDVTVYFYSPTCVYCQRTTPVLVPLTEELDVEMVKLNLLEFGAEAEKYQITGTPTLIHFKDGEEVARIDGEHPEDVFKEFFETNVLE